MSFVLERRFLAHLLLLAVVAGAAVLASFSPTHAQEKRLALVVGNAAYRNVTSLTNSANDARDIAEKLKSLKFDVLLAVDARQEEMIALLETFRSRLTRDHVALVFYAGHGVTINRESFLLPIDVPAVIQADANGDLPAEAANRQLVGMASVLGPLEAARIGILFLDACRTSTANAAGRGSPFRVAAARGTRAVPVLRGNGSLEIRPSPYSAGVFRAYATQLDNVASDGTGRNSPFTRALLRHMSTRGISIQELMMRVRKSVMEETRNAQVPWEEAALNDNFYFVPTPPAAARPAASGGKAGSGSTPARTNLPPNLGVGVGGGL
jgi:uncharacterized caspase-like protein